VLAFKGLSANTNLAGEDALLIMDNVSDPADSHGFLLLGFICAEILEETGVHLILTSRVRAKPDAIHWIEVEKLRKKMPWTCCGMHGCQMEKPRTDPIDEIGTERHSGIVRTICPYQSAGWQPRSAKA